MGIDAQSTSDGLTGEKHPRRRRRAPSLLATALAVGLGLSACSSAAGAGSSHTLTIWSRAATKGFISQVVTAFNDSQSGVKANLTIVPDDTYVQKFGAAAATGNAPDVAVLDTARMQQFASKGALKDISSKTKTLSYYDKLAPAQLNLAKYKGGVYGVPFDAEASVLFYNKTLLDKAHVNPASLTSYAGVRAAADAVHSLGSDTFGYDFSGASGGGNNFGTIPYLWASGGSLLSKDGQQASFDTPQVADLLQFLKGMWDAGDIPKSAQTDIGPALAPAFLSGKVGMITSGAFFMAQLKAKDPGFQWGLTVIPGKNGGSASFSGGDQVVIPTGTKNEAAAWQFAQFASSEQAQTILAKVGTVPTRTDLMPKIYDPLDPRYPTVAKAVLVGQSPKTTLSNALFGDSQGPLATMIGNAVFGRKSVPDAMATAQKAAENIIQQNQ